MLVQAGAIDFGEEAPALRPTRSTVGALIQEPGVKSGSLMVVSLPWKWDSTPIAANLNIACHSAPGDRGGSGESAGGGGGAGDVFAWSFLLLFQVSYIGYSF